jgi:serine-type D-Ala-D-Ala carboxypeptidase/endopeptidase (penicillin-binding protein 4)
VVLVIVLALVLAGAAYLGTYQWRTHRDASPAAPTPSSVLTPSAVISATAAPSTPVGPAAAPLSAAALAHQLAGPIANAKLGGRVLVSVATAATGTVLFNHGATIPAAPASTAKIATAAAVLLALGPTARITTKVVTGASPTSVVLVGGGDPTLTAAAPGSAPAYPDAARISDLAAQLKQSGVNPTQIVVDGALFSGPRVSPAWDATDVPTDYGAPITATMVDGGRDSPTATIRSADPALAAGIALAAALGLPASAVTTGVPPAVSRQLAAVQSAPIDELVGQMLGESDNIIAEMLARQVAIARGAPASFAGAVTAVRDELSGIGVNIGTGLVDGSGLAASDRISPAALVALLAAATGSAHPALHDLLAALPVAGWTGTLADRFTGTAAAGSVRAKTGTLTSVSALAGTVHDASGALLVFALIADQVGPSSADTDAAEGALDGIVSSLAACGCS